MKPKPAFPPMLLGALLVASCQDPTATAPPADLSAPRFSATSEWLEFTFPTDAVSYVPCLAEYVHATGTVSVRLHQAATPTETRLLFLAEPEDDWQLEGLTTHQIWAVVPGNQARQLQTASGNLFIFVERFVFTNQTTGAVLDWPLRITFVVDANGSVRVDRVEGDVCRLRH